MEIKTTERVLFKVELIAYLKINKDACGLYDEIDSLLDNYDLTDKSSLFIEHIFGDKINKTKKKR